MRPTLEASYTDITEVYLECLRQGKRVSVEALAKQFPMHASRIRSELPLMAALETNLASQGTEIPQVPGYQTIRELGRGASGMVYLAKHESGKPVAIKLVKFDGQFQHLERLDREVECLKRIQHPNIVAVNDFGVYESYLYIVTTFIEGITLADLKRPESSIESRYWSGELQKDWDHIARWGLEIASALEHIHKHKIIHRDIKPSNLLLDKSGKCWLIDFGLAKVGEYGMTVSRSEQIAGTPRFMAPEQLRGVVNASCDIYSLGRTLFELASTTSDTEKEGALNSSIPPDLTNIINKACETKPELRYQSASELVAVFDRYLDGKSPSDRRRAGKRMSEQEFKAKMRRRVRSVTVAAFFGCAALITLVFVYGLRTPSDREFTVPLAANGNQDQRAKSLASVIENEESGFVELIGEVVKQSVITQGGDKQAVDEVASKIDRVVQKVTSEGLAPGELDGILVEYRESPLMYSGKARALHNAIHNSTLTSDEKKRGHVTLELFARAIENKRVPSEVAGRMLASLFRGEIPKLESVIAMRIADDSLRAWLKLVETSFGDELRSTSTEGSRANQELSRIIDRFLEQDKD